MFKPCAHRELTVTRIIDPPREFVFKAWTDPNQMAPWWGQTASRTRSAKWTRGRAAPFGS